MVLGKRALQPTGNLAGLTDWLSKSGRLSIDGKFRISKDLPGKVMAQPEGKVVEHHISVVLKLF